MKHTIEILDANLNPITPVLTPYPLDKGGNILQYSKQLSNVGLCKFRISAYDSLLDKWGAIYTPHKYHIRIKRDGFIAWQGAIVDAHKRTKDYIEIDGATYLWYLNKKMVHRTSPDPVSGKAGIYRIFSSGGMDAAVTAIMNETIADYSSFATHVNGQGVTILDAGHILHNMTVGQVDNPNYPPNLTDANGNKLTGPWKFVAVDQSTGGLTLQYDFHKILYILRSFGGYTFADFEIDNNLVFNFKKFIGNNKQYQVNLFWGKRGNAFDYNLPLLGDHMVNSLTGVATDNNGTVLFYDQSDQGSIGDNGLLEDVAAYSDIKSQNVLNARIQAELPLISQPDDTLATIVLDERTNYPIGTWDIGDIVNMQVVNKGVNFNEPRRVVGISTTVGNTGRELTTVQTNKPLDWQYGIAGT